MTAPETVPPLISPAIFVVHKNAGWQGSRCCLFSYSKSKEYAQCNTGDKLCGNTLKPCIRCIVKQVQREMPQSPEYTKDENSFSHSKMLLQDRLQKVTPSIFFSEKGGKDEEKADKQRKQWQPEHRRSKKSEEGICSIVCEAGNQKISCKQHEKQNYIQKVSSAVRPGPGQSPDKADFTFVKKKQNPESQIARQLWAYWWP